MLSDCAVPGGIVWQSWKLQQFWCQAVAFRLRWGQVSILMSGMAQRGNEHIIAVSLQALWLCWRSPAEPGCSLSLAFSPACTLVHNALMCTWLNFASPHPSSAGMLVYWIRIIALINVLTAINSCESDVFWKALCDCCGDMDVFWLRWICSHCTENLFVHNYILVLLRQFSLYSATLYSLCIRSLTGGIQTGWKLFVGAYYTKS